MTTPPLISAHRGGAMNPAEENRRETFARSSRDPRCDYVEFDVHRTRDDVFVVAHDEVIVDAHGERHFIAELAYEDLSAIDPEICTMREVLEILAEGGKGAHVDFKFTEGELSAMDQIEEYFDRDGYVVTTCLDESLRVIRDAYGYDEDASGHFVHLGLSLGDPNAGWTQRFADRYLAHRRLDTCGADVVVANVGAARRHLANLAHDTDRWLLVWTPTAFADLSHWSFPGRCWMLTTNDVAGAHEVAGTWSRVNEGSV